MNNIKITKEHYKLLIRNLRNKKNEKLAISTIGSDIRFEKTCESVHVPEEIESNYRRR
jgi:hypothetical protein